MDSETQKERDNQILNKYYSLKNEYDTKYNDYKKNLLKNKTLDMKEKKKELLKHKRKCIKCGKKDGTIFINTNEILEVKCGDISSPCDLKIKIEKNLYDYIPEGIKDTSSTINDIKTEIIKNKLDLLFQYSNENDVLTLFKKQSSELNEFMEYYNELITIDINLHHDSKKKIELKNMNITKNELLEQIKELLDIYKKEKNNSAIKDIISIYKNDLYPLISQENLIKYSHTTIDYNTKNDTYNLNQPKFSFCDIFIKYGTLNVVEDSTNKSK